MNEHLALWKRIEANESKVPNLRVKYQSCDDCVTVNGYRFGDDPGNNRVGALLVVDALEAAGLAYFDRYACPAPKEWCYVGYQVESCEPSAVRQGKQEHIALLDCIAATLEALPVTPEVQTDAN